MISSIVEMKKKGYLSLVPFLVMVMAAAFIFAGCDAGDSPSDPSSIDAVSDPLYDESTAGVSVSLSDSRLTVVNSATAPISASTGVKAYYTDANGNPVEGQQMNFEVDTPEVANDTGTGTVPAITFNPYAVYTDENGLGSTGVYVRSNTPAGSYTIVAYTSPASGGANATGYVTLYVSN